MGAETLKNVSVINKIIDAIWPQSDGSELITDVECKAILEHFPEKFPDLEYVLTSIRSINDGVALSDDEVSKIEQMEGGRDFLIKLGRVSGITSSYKIFGPRAPYINDRLKPWFLFAAGGLDISPILNSGDEGDIAEALNILKKYSAQSVITNSDTFIGDLPEKHLEFYDPKTLHNYLSIMADQEKRSILKMLVFQFPFDVSYLISLVSKYNGIDFKWLAGLELVSQRTKIFASKNPIAIPPAKEFEKFKKDIFSAYGSILSLDYMPDGIFYVLWEGRKLLLSPSFQQYFIEYISNTKMTKLETLFLMFLASRSTLPTDAYLKNAKKATDIFGNLSSDIVRQHAVAAFFAIPFINEDGVAFLRWVDTSTNNIGPDIFGTALLFACAWPKGAKVSDIVSSVEKFVGSLDVLFILHFANTPIDYKTIANPDFRHWVSKLKSESGHGVIIDASRLISYARIYQMGSKAHDEIFSPSFKKNWQELNKRLTGTDRELYPEVALLLLTYPMKRGWHEFDRFLDENKLRPPTAEKYKMFTVIQEYPEIRRTFEKIKKDPFFGERLVYSRPPQKRSDSNAIYNERPEWNKLPILFKLRAIMLKEALTLNDGFLQTIAHELIKDTQDTRTEHGGGMVLQNNNGIARLAIKPAISTPISDGYTTITGPAILIDFIFYHQHALTLENAFASGPSCGRIELKGKTVYGGDCGAAFTHAVSSIVITTVGLKESEGSKILRFNVDIYGPDPTTVVDLGVYEVAIK